MAAAQDGVALQGLLRSNGGQAVDGIYKLKVTLLDGAEGQALYSEVHNDVPVSEGVFQLRLGSLEPIGDALVQQNQTPWLSVSVDNEPALPAVQMHKQWWARGADTALTAGGLSCSGCITSAHLDIGIQATLLGLDGAVKGLQSDVSAVKGTLADLLVDSAVVVGDTASDCDGASAGAIKFVAADKAFYGCDGEAWVKLKVQGNGLTLAVTNPTVGPLTDFQVRVDAAVFIGEFGDNFQIVDPAGQPVPYCWVQPGGECSTTKSTVLWMRVATLPGATTSLFTFLPSEGALATGGQSVFDFYEDFNAPAIDSNKWSLLLAGCTPVVEAGQLRSTEDTGQNQVCGVRSKVFGATDNSAVEVRVSVGTDGGQDCDPNLLLADPSYANNQQAAALKAGWIADDESANNVSFLTPYGDPAVYFSDKNLRGTTFTASVEVLGGQLRACLTDLGPECSPYVPWQSDKNRIITGAHAYQGIPWSNDWVRVRKLAAAPPTSSFQL